MGFVSGIQIQDADAISEKTGRSIDAWIKISGEYLTFLVKYDRILLEQDTRSF